MNKSMNRINICMLQIITYKGIRYAAPPTGNLRWSRPVPVWKDSTLCQREHRRRVTKFGSPCFQVNPFTKQFEGKED
ncbi:Neurotactin-like protein, partial [Leptotrombidium deliense]